MIWASFSVAALALSATGYGQEAADPGDEAVLEAIPAYEDQLLRLSEILGSLHFLRALCRSGDALVWKNEMNHLLEAEEPSLPRRDRLIARFNFGFETYHAVYETCTPAARTAMSRYLDEGEKITAELRLRYGQ